MINTGKSKQLRKHHQYKFAFLDQSQTNVEYHREFQPPPEGSTTGVGKVEQVVPVVDRAHDMEQIQHRFVGSLFLQSVCVNHLKLLS